MNIGDRVILEEIPAIGVGTIYAFLHENLAVITLDAGFYSVDRKIFTTMMVVNMGNLVPA